MKFGDLASPCGKGDAKGATEQGVTDTSIRIGYGDDRGFAGAPGLEQDAGDAVKAMIQWCNDQGGINGRKITGDYYDAAITQTNNVMQKACKADFMLVGQAFAGDEAAEAARVNCKLVSVPTYAVGPDVANAPMYYSAVPNPVDQQPASGFAQLLKLQPGLKDGFGYIDSPLPAVTATIAKVKVAAAAAGYKVLDCGVSISNQGEPSYAPFVNKFKSCGAKVIYVPFNPSPVVFNFIASMNQANVKATYLSQANGYAAYFAQANKAGLYNDFYVQMPFQLLENAADDPATKAYLDAVAKVKGTTGLLGMQATSSFLLWATAAKDCGSTLTRQCMVNKLSAVHDWTAGGLNGKTDPGANKATTCGLLAKLDGTKWVQAYPKENATIECQDSYAVEIPKSAQLGVTLNSDRIATKFLTSSVIKPQN
ncbi:MAG: ABC transporter substrate-binding protein [Jatrophihabitans sp.]